MKTDTTLSRQLFVVPTLVVLIGIALAGCAETPRRRYVEAPRAAPVINTEVYAYPKNGQSANDQKRDRYECYNWAVAQTGFDPGRLRGDTTMRQVNVDPVVSPNHDATVLGITGAVLGAAVSRPSNALGGAAIGAVVGAAAGSASDANREATAERIEHAENANQRAQYSQLAQRAAEYRRAMGACLEGRGYSVH